MCGTKIWHHKCIWPNRPPLIAHIDGVTSVALKSGTTNMYGQIGPPENNKNKTKQKKEKSKMVLSAGNNDCRPLLQQTIPIEKQILDILLLQTTIHQI